MLEVVVICFHSCCSPKDFEKGIEKLLFKSMIHSKGFRKASIKNKSFGHFQTVCEFTFCRAGFKAAKAYKTCLP